MVFPAERAKKYLADTGHQTLVWKIEKFHQKNYSRALFGHPDAGESILRLEQSANMANGIISRTKIILGHFSGIQPPENQYSVQVTQEAFCPGIDPGPPAWKARHLPPVHRETEHPHQSGAR